MSSVDHLPTHHLPELNPKKPIVLSLGGSILVPGEIDREALATFYKTIKHAVEQGFRFVVVVGGGATARKYQQAARDVGSLDRDDLDWIGIHSTRLNGHLLRTVFKAMAHPVVVKNPHRFRRGGLSSPVTVLAGWKPGWSTDYIAVIAARHLKAEMVINISNTPCLFSADPKTHPDAVPVPRMDWASFCRLVGNTWDPGMNVPFDPVASRAAERAHLQAVLMGGRDFVALRNLLSGKTFIGSIVDTKGVKG